LAWSLRPRKSIRFLLNAEREQCSSPILILAFYQFQLASPPQLPFKTANAHTLNEETEDPKNSLQRPVCQLIPSAKSRPEPNVFAFGTKKECVIFVTELATRQGT